MHFDEVKFTKILQWILLSLLIFLLLATIIVFFAKGPRAVKTYRIADPKPSEVVNYSSRTSDKLAAYTEIGQIRTLTKSPDNETLGTSIIITPWFAYPESDKTFYEELSQKQKMEKSIIAEYFTQFTEEELLEKGEKKIKEELLEKLNQNFVLGQISSLYFTDYIFIKGNL